MISGTAGDMGLRRCDMGLNGVLRGGMGGLLPHLGRRCIAVS
jgi:hypothetical protein